MNLRPIAKAKKNDKRTSSKEDKKALFRASPWFFRVKSITNSISFVFFSILCFIPV